MAVGVFALLLSPVALVENVSVPLPLVVGQFGPLIGETQKALPMTGTLASSSDLDGWDAFRVFVLKSFSPDVVDSGVRDELFEVLLTDRCDQLASQAGDAPKTPGESASNDRAVLMKRLDRWVPQIAEFDVYKPVLRQLLQMTTDSVLQSTTLDSGGFTEDLRLAVNQTSLLVQ